MPLLSLFLDHSHGKDRQFVQQNAWQCERELRENVRRREYRRDDENDHNRVAPLSARNCDETIPA